MDKESRKRAWTKYNQSAKRKLVSARYNRSYKGGTYEYNY